MYYATNNNGQPGTKYRKGRPFTKDDIQYPTAIWGKSDADLATLLGVYPMIRASGIEADYYANSAANTWTFSNNQFIEGNVPVLKSADIVKHKRLGELAIKAQSVRSGGITVLTKNIATDEHTIHKINLISSALTAGEPYPTSIPFYTMEGDKVAVNEANFAVLTKAMAVHMINVDKNLDTHEDAINALTDAQAIIDYDITTGWPANPVLNP